MSKLICLSRELQNVRDEHGLESESDWSWSRFWLICNGVGLKSESFSFRPFSLVRGGHSISSFSTSFCLQHPSPSHQLLPYLLSLHLKIFSLVSFFSSFPETPFPSSFFLHTLDLSSSSSCQSWSLSFKNQLISNIRRNIFIS